MRLTCNSCGSRFVIDDKLVRGKVVRLLCKHCANVLEASLPSTPPAPLRLEPSGSPPKPPPPPGPKWYLALYGRVLGPMGLAELRLRVRRGEVLPDDLVWHSGLSGWQPISLTEEIRQELPKRLQPAMIAPPPALAGPLPQQGGTGPLPTIPPMVGAYPAQPYAAPLAGPYAPQASQTMTGEHSIPSFSATPPLGSPQIAYPWPASPNASRYAAWPLWLGIIGGLMMLAATITLLWVQLERRSPAEHPAQPTAQALRAGSARLDKRSAPQVLEVPALEVHGARAAGGERANQGSSRSTPEAHALARTTRPASNPAEAVTSISGQQLYAHYRASLEACDRLAQERGEATAPSTSTHFALIVDAQGKRTLRLRGEGLTPGLIACYRASVAQWNLPQSEDGLRLSFVHSR